MLLKQLLHNLLQFHSYPNNDGIAIGCAATALAATIYSEYDFETTHSLFKIPVDTDNDKDEDEFNCQLDNGKHQERNELLKVH